MIYNIRGGLGTQLLQLYAVYADSIENNTPIDQININLGFYNQLTGEKQHDYINNVVDFADPITINIVDGTQKFDVIRFPERVSLISKHLEEIQRRVLIRPQPNAAKFNPTVVHIRGRDRAMVSIETYVGIVLNILSTNEPLTIITDDTIIKDGFDYQLVSTNDNDHYGYLDWFSLTQSLKCISGVSLYTIAAAVASPNLHLYILPKEYSVLNLPDNIWNGINNIVECFNNIEWYTNGKDIHTN